MNSIPLITLSMIAGLSLAETLSGTYEFPPPEGLEGDSAIIKLEKDEDGNYLAQVTVAEETIKGTNVIVGESQFSFDIKVKIQEGEMSQAYKVQLDDDGITLSILSDLDGRSESMTFKGRLIKEIEGTYTFPPPEGVNGDTTKIQLAKDDQDNYTVSGTVGDETIEATNVIVKSEEFSFDTVTKTQNGDMTQAWKVQVSVGEATLSILAEVGGQSQSITLKGSLETDERSPEN